MFDGPPGLKTCQFIRIEREDGSSVNAGEWEECENGLWALCLHVSNEDIRSAAGASSDAETEFPKDVREFNLPAIKLNLPFVIKDEYVDDIYHKEYLEEYEAKVPWDI